MNSTFNDNRPLLTGFERRSELKVLHYIGKKESEGGISSKEFEGSSKTIEGRKLMQIILLYL